MSAGLPFFKGRAGRFFCNTVVFDKSMPLRPLKFHRSYLPHSEGSCLVSMGHTQVLCVASVENKVPPHAEEKGMGWIHAEYAMLPRAGETRSPRQKVASGGRAQEISRLLGRSLRAAVKMEALVNKTITIDCDVLRADGGTRTASINGGMVALVESLKFLWKKGDLKEWPLKYFVGAVSIGVVKNELVLDMAYGSDKEAQVDVNVVMTEEGRLIEIQGTAEQRPFSITELRQMLDLSSRAIKNIISTQKKVLGPLPSTKLW